MSKLQASIALAILFLIAGLLALAEVRRGAPPPLPAYEYMVEAIPDLAFERDMNALGAAGWEMVTARRASGGNDDVRYECIFKRLTLASASAKSAATKKDAWQ